MTPGPLAPTMVVTSPRTVLMRGESLLLEVAVTNFTLVDPANGDHPREGQGHYHVFTDSEVSDLFDAWTTTLMIPTDPSQTTGVHAINVILVDGFHVDLEPRITASVSFTLL